MPHAPFAFGNIDDFIEQKLEGNAFGKCIPHSRHEDQSRQPVEPGLRVAWLSRQIPGSGGSSHPARKHLRLVETIGETLVTAPKPVKLSGVALVDLRGP